MSVSRRDFLAPAPRLPPAWPSQARRARCRSSRSGPGRARRPRPSPAARSSSRRRTATSVDPSGKRGIQVAYDMLSRAPIRSTPSVAGVQIVELDPNDQSRRTGRAARTRKASFSSTRACMHGPTKRAGSVGCLEDIADAGRGRARRDGLHRPHHARRRRARRSSRSRWGSSSRICSPSRAGRTGCAGRARLNSSDNWLDIPRDRRAPTPPRRRSVAAGRGALRRAARLLRRARRSVHVRHDQHERRHRQRRHRAR